MITHVSSLNRACAPRGAHGVRGRRGRVLRSLLAALCVLAVAFALAMPASLAWAAPGAETTEQENAASGTGQSGGTGEVAENENANKVNEGQLPDSSFLYDTAISELAQADAFYDNQTVQVRGEVVGDRIADEAGQGYWITLQDIETKTATPTVVAVLMNEEQTQAIDTYGHYGTTGTILQVRGTFHLECKTHQGLSDVHAEQVTPVTKGSAREISVNSAVLAAAVLAMAFGIGLLVLYNVLRERAR